MDNRLGQIYICQICGNEVEFKKDGGGQLICCGQEMEEKKAA